MSFELFGYAIFTVVHIKINYLIDHIVHHVIALWVLGATSEELQDAYDLNKTYRLPQFHHDASAAVGLKDPVAFKKIFRRWSGIV